MKRNLKVEHFHRISKRKPMNSIVHNSFGLEASELNIKIEPFEIKEEELLSEPLTIKNEVEIEVKNEPLEFDEPTLIDKDVDSVSEDYLLGFETPQNNECPLIQQQFPYDDDDRERKDKINCDEGKTIECEDLVSHYRKCGNDLAENSFGLQASERYIKSEPLEIDEEEEIKEKHPVKSLNIKNEVKNEPLEYDEPSLIDEDVDSGSENSFFEFKTLKSEECPLIKPCCSSYGDERERDQTNICERKNMIECENVSFRKLRESKFPIVLLHKLTNEEIEKILLSGHRCTSKIKRIENLKSEICDGKNLKSIISVLNSNRNKNVSKINGKRFRCSDCHYITEYKSNLKSHKLVHSNSNVKLFRCDVCNYGTNYKNALKFHLLKHSATKLFSCADRDYECNEKMQPRHHLNRKEFHCSKCSYATNNKARFKIHSFVHSEVKRFECSNCEFQTNDKQYLKAHLLNHTNIKLFKCEKCPYGTNEKRELKYHMFKHLGVKPFKCTKCSFEAYRKIDLKYHLLEHSASKRFNCSSCDYKTNSKRDLKIHVLNHLDSKLYKCSQCVYTTNVKCNLKTHLLKHANEKKFRCSDCSYGTNFKKELIKHILRHPKL